MEKIFNAIKAGAIAVIGGLTGWLGVLAVPLYCLIGANIIDYITGLIAAPYRGEMRNSYKGIKGITKKVCMWLLVAVGVLTDIIIEYAAARFGWAVPKANIVGCIVCVWILTNELLSIIENIADTGVAVPAFMEKIIKWVKKQSEKEIGGDSNDGSGNVEKGD